MRLDDYGYPYRADYMQRGEAHNRQDLFMTEDDVRELLRERAAPFAKRARSTGVAGWCEHHGIDRGHASEFLNARRSPRTSILDALGLQWAIVPKSETIC